jgi:hypothetical protein
MAFRQKANSLASLPRAFEVQAVAEVKADAAPSSDSARHLHWLGDRIGDRLLGGFVLHTGPRAFRLSGSVAAIPICALWAQPGETQVAAATSASDSSVACRSRSASSSVTQSGGLIFSTL